MAVEPCWHKWIIGGHRREYEHFDAAYSGGFALGQLRPKPRSEPICGSAPIPVIGLIARRWPRSADKTLRAN